MSLKSYKPIQNSRTTILVDRKNIWKGPIKSLTEEKFIWW